MVSTSSQLVVCYSLGTGAGFDVQLAGLSRQICEDIAEILALNEDFVTIAQMLLVREGPEGPRYGLGLKSTAFAVFYSLPETRWIIESTRAIGGDIALTGRLVDDEDGLILSINMLDVRRNVLLFCGLEHCERDAIHHALMRLGARILASFSDRSIESWAAEIRMLVGTDSYHAYANWMSMRETERRAQREGLPAAIDRMAEHLTYALVADPNYDRALDALCDIMGKQLKTATYHFILKKLEAQASLSASKTIVVVQCLARIGNRLEADDLLGKSLEQWPESGVLWLMRGALAVDPVNAARYLSQAERLLGSEFARYRRLVDNGLLNVVGQ